MTLADENEWARVCLYGRYGTGKTTDLAYAANLGTVVHIDAEKRLKGGPLRRLGIPINQIEAHREINYEALGDLITNVAGRLYDQPGSVAAVNMDSVTEITKLLVGQVLDKNVEKSLARAEKRGEEIEVNAYQIDLDYWGEMTEQMRRLMRHMRDLECHLGFAAHERRDTDSDGEIVIGPATTPAVQQDLMGYVDVIGHTAMDGPHFVARFNAGTKYQAKDTFGVLPDVMVNPTMDRIVRYVREELTLETDVMQQEYLAYCQQRADRIKAAALATENGGSRRRARTS